MGEVTVRKSATILAQDPARGLFRAVLLEPSGGLDATGVEAAAHDFLRKYRAGTTSFLGDSAVLVESQIAPCDFTLGGRVVRAGSWLVVAATDPATLAALADGLQVIGKGERDEPAAVAARKQHTPSHRGNTVSKLGRWASEIEKSADNLPLAFARIAKSLESEYEEGDGIVLSHLIGAAGLSYSQALAGVPSELAARIHKAIRDEETAEQERPSGTSRTRKSDAFDEILADIELVLKARR